MAGFFRRSKAVAAPVKSAGTELGSPDSITENEVRAVVTRARNLPPEKLWETQHNVRVAVDFLARNVAQTGAHVFANQGEAGRERVRDSVAAKLLKAPNPQHTGYELFESLVSDIALFSEAWWWVFETKDGFQIIPLPVREVQVDSGREILGTLVIRFQAGGQTVLIKQKNLLHFRQWHPDYTTNVSPAVTALRDVLAEQIAAQAFRVKVWQNGGQINQYVHRPKDAPEWSDAAEAGFKEAIKTWRSGGGGEGSMPLIADGMEIRDARLNAKQEQWAESYQLALETCARAWHIQPSMLGATGGISYANLREFRKMLYGETLGPILEMIQDRLNRFLLPMLGEPENHYVEFNTKQRLAASFDEQAASYSSAVGRPWMTADEVRGIENLPALGGDAGELITPLNVVAGGQASPRDSAPKSRDGVQVKVDSDDDGVEVDVEAMAGEVAEVLRKFFTRQERVLLTVLGAKADDDWWDTARWDNELTDDLYKVAVKIADQLGRATALTMGFDPRDYDVEATRAYLKAVAEGRAGMINRTTRDRIATVVELEKLSVADAVRMTLTEAIDVRASEAGVTMTTALDGFTSEEAAKQLAPGSTKTWVVNSGNPRPSHAAMDGETVAVSDHFSNGMLWPGDWAGGVDEVAGCQCSIDITTVI